MNTNTPRTALLLTTLTLSLGAVGCGGGSASMSVEDGVVTEVHEVTADDLSHLRVTIRYPQDKLLEGAIRHHRVRVVKRPRLGERIPPREDLNPRTHLPEAKPSEQAPARDRIVAGEARPSRPDLERTPAEDSVLDRLRQGEPPVRSRPEWMQVELQGVDNGRYTVVLVGPQEQPDDRIHPGIIRQ